MLPARVYTADAVSSLNKIFTIYSVISLSDGFAILLQSLYLYIVIIL